VVLGNSTADLTSLICVLRYFVKVNLFNCGICTETVGRNPYTYVGVPKPNTSCAYFIHKFLPSWNLLSGNPYLNTKTEMTFIFIHSYKNGIYEALKSTYFETSILVSVMSPRLLKL